MPATRNHDEYLAALPADQRQALQALRTMIRAAAPQAEETISYGICAFREGVMLVGYGATAKHCAFFLMSNQTTTTHAADLKGYDLSTGTIRFQPDRPLPMALVQKLVRARQAENAARLMAKPKPAAAKKAMAKKAAPKKVATKAPSDPKKIDRKKTDRSSTDRASTTGPASRKKAASATAGQKSTPKKRVPKSATPRQGTKTSAARKKKPAS
ncbi:MAG TPA: hypothetical protein DDY91_11935 [Planctomycetaceae bacterium]|nr:hypothetical protein [Planctomycetaceae bacterium]